VSEVIGDWREEPIARHHARDEFNCGEPELDEYLKRYARQNHEAGGSKTFVAVRNQDDRILGYYSITFTVLDHEDVPERLRGRSGRYEVPVFLLGRLAVDRSVQGQGLGEMLVLRAGIRCLRVAQEVGGFGLLIDAKNERVAEWYQRLGAERLAPASLQLLLPMKTIATSLDRLDNPRE